MRGRDDYGVSSECETGIAASFRGAKNAFRAIRMLHKAGMTRTWIGFFHPSSGETAAVLDIEWEGDPFEARGVFPMRDGLRRPIQETLQRQGVPKVEARSFQGMLGSRGIVVVVNAGPRFDEARAVLLASGGQLATREQIEER